MIKLHDLKYDSTWFMNLFNRKNFYHNNNKPNKNLEVYGKFLTSQRLLIFNKV